MTEQEAQQVILDIIEEIAPDEDLSNVDPETRLRDQLDLDSMDFLDIVLELRKQHGIQVPEEDYPRLATLQGCGEYLAPKITEKAAQAGA